MRSDWPRWLVLAALAAVAGAACWWMAPGCRGVDHCVERLEALAQPGKDYGGVGPAEQALAADFVRLGDAAIEPLVLLLADVRPEVAELAASVLIGFDRIDPRFLPQIRAGIDRGLGWLPAALGRIDSDEAAREAVARYLASPTSPNDQAGAAVILHGARALPYLLAAADCGTACGDRDLLLVSDALGRMGAAGGAAAAQLLALVQRTQTPVANARQLLYAIGRLGDAALGVEAGLLALAQSRDELRVAVDDALIAMRSTHAGTILAARLRTHGGDEFLLREIAEAGSLARAAGPEVAALLRAEDWNLRAAAARTLGFIGHVAAADALIALLDDPADVRLHWVVVDALARMKLPAARPVLQRIADAHWHVEVQGAAHTALRQLASGLPYTPPVQGRLGSFFAYRQGLSDTRSCIRPGQTLRAPQPGKLHFDAAKPELERLAYSDPEPVFKPRAAAPGGVGKDGARVTMADSRVVPEVALRVEDGWLAGSDRGEFGGEIMFIGDDGERQLVADVNVEDFHRLGPHLLAVTGLAHLGHNDGRLLRLARGADGRWQALPWRSLPNAPMASAMLADGDLWLGLVEGGSIVVSADGRMRMATCAEEWPRWREPADS